MTLPHEGHTAIMPGRTKTKEKYISFSDRKKWKTFNQYVVRVPGPAGRTSDSFPMTQDGWAAALACRYSVLANQPPPAARRRRSPTDIGLDRYIDHVLEGKKIPRAARKEIKRNTRGLKKERIDALGDLCEWPGCEHPASEVELDCTYTDLIHLDPLHMGERRTEINDVMNFCTIHHRRFDHEVLL